MYSAYAELNITTSFQLILYESVQMLRLMALAAPYPDHHCLFVIQRLSALTELM